MITLVQTWLAWLWVTTWQGSVLVAVVLIVQAGLGSRMPARWRCALWWVVVVRLFLPASISSPVSLFNVGFLSPPSALKLFGTVPGASDAIAAWLFWVWVAGMGLTVGRIGREHLKLRRAFIRRRLVTDSNVLETLEDCKTLARVHAPLVVMETNRVRSPALFGFIRPRLLLPEGLLRTFSKADLRHVFVHELSHLRRHDIALGWLQALVLSVHWFNPVIWLAMRRLRGDRELATDELALHHLEVKENQAYGQTILKLLDDFGRPVSTPALAGILEDRSQLVRRIQRVAGFGQARRWTQISMWVLAVLVVVCLTDRRARPGERSEVPTGESGRSKQLPP